jgi:hypothetical protein
VNSAQRIDSASLARSREVSSIERVRAKIRKSQAAQDGIADNVGKALDDLLASLRGEIVNLLDNPTDNEAARAAVLNLRASQVEAMIADLLDGVRVDWTQQLQQLEAGTIAALDAAGISLEDAQVSVEDMHAIFDAQREQSSDYWTANVERPMADAILRGLQASAAGLDLDEVVRRTVEQVGITIPAAITEVRTATAEYDRYVAAQAVEAVDPTGELFAWGYTGPDDGLERPFCDAINGLALTTQQVQELDNGPRQPGAPAYNGGGYNCRHQWVRAPMSALVRMGYERGTDGDVKAANAAARGKQK